ncbi:MAG: nuclear transport factor 2 family protein [SAR202 cluster bacterium]|nr:nuclear transport factor 2 family protein [SAR202 cluster bacterium]
MSRASRQRTMDSVIDDIIGKGQFDLVDELYTKDFIWHAPSIELRGREQLKGLFADFRAAFPGRTYTYELQIHTGDFVIGRWVLGAGGRAEGAHHGREADRQAHPGDRHHHPQVRGQPHRGGVGGVRRAGDAAPVGRGPTEVRLTGRSRRCKRFSAHRRTCMSWTPATRRSCG